MTEKELLKILNKSTKKRMEFSKKIFIGVSISTLSVAIFSMYMMYITKDLSPMSYLIGAVFAEFATATGFYYWKAKNENVIKIGESINQEYSMESEEQNYG